MHDIRYAFRTLRKDWGFTVVAVLTLALAIGANTAIFSVVDAVVIRPLGFPAADRLYAIHEHAPKFAKIAPLIPVNALHYRNWARGVHSAEQIALLDGSEKNLTGAGDPELVATARATPSLFPMLGLRVQLGRVIAEGDDEDGHDRVVVLDAKLWRERFSANPNIVGTKITLDDTPFEVIGVLADDFHFPKLNHLYALETAEKQPLLWRPFVIRENELSALGDFNYAGIVRLRPGARPEQAASEMNAIVAGLMEKEPDKIEIDAVLVPLQEQLVSRSGTGLRLMLAAVGAVLLIGCVNIANLMLARSARRQREAAIRRAVGASGARLVRQVLVEGLMLSGTGGLLGIATAWALLRAILANLPADLPRAETIRLDPRVLLFTLCISTAAGLLFALLPAWRFTRAAPQDALRTGGRGTSSGRSAGRLRAVLVSTEVGLSVVCLIAGGLLLRSFAKLVNVDRGFETHRIVTVSVNLPQQRYPNDPAAITFFRDLLRRTAALPGVESAGIVNRLPLSGEGGNNSVVVEGENLPMSERPLADFRRVSADYFRTMGIALRHGRIFEQRDGEHQECVVSEMAAARFWPGRDPVGRRLQQWTGPNSPWMEVTGVVGDIRGAGLASAPRPTVYQAYWQRSLRSATLAVRTTNAEPTILAGEIRRVIHEGDAALPVPEFQTMDQVLAGSVATRRFQMNLVLLFAAAALLLASLGIYGVVSYTVTQRTNEIGVRMALGAPPARILTMVMRQGLAPVAAGLLVGATGAIALGRVLGSLLFGVGAADPLTMVGVAAMLALTAASAILAPARRAMRVEPSMALRDE